EPAEAPRPPNVARPRARPRLFLTRAEARSLWGQHQYNPPSQFLGEIPETLIDWEREGTTRSAGSVGLTGAGT
uniref:hypothetical protein n=1 Tax=Micrococcus sp. GbtcB5 TaxID=2824750 RepID=UPI0020C5E241